MAITPITATYIVTEPIEAEFSITEPTSVEFSISEPIEAEFSVSYDRPRTPKRLGIGYTGDRMANELI